MKNVFVLLLYPFSLIYGCLVEIRGLLYKLGVFKTERTSIFSIGVGNLTVGGTGKTPHVEYLIEQFINENKLATLSRGYGRKTIGFIPVQPTNNAEQVGDEPWQLFLKYGSNVRINVGEKRVPAEQKIHQLYPEVNMLILDDVYQHRAIQPDYMILLCDYNRPFFDDYPFPAGRLREFRSGAKRADTIVVTKCPSTFSSEERTAFQKSIQRVAPDVPVAFSKFTYGKVKPVFSSAIQPLKWLLVTGIANPKPLVEHLQKQGNLVQHIEYSDHHDFSAAESTAVLNAYNALADKEVGVLVTEKDFARLSDLTKQMWQHLPLFYIPITVSFLEGEDLLLQNIQRARVRKA